MKYGGNMKIGVMTDVNAGLDYVGYDTKIPCLRSSVNFKDKSYVDGIDIRADEFYRRLLEVKSSKDIPSTSAPSVADIYKTLDKFVEEGYTDVLHFPISFCLSSTGETVAKIAEEYAGKLNVHVMNTKTAVYMQGFIAQEAKKMADNNLPLDEIIARSQYLIDHQHAYFVVDDLDYLVKNGRLSNGKKFLGTLLKIKPILELNDEGKIVNLEKVKTYSRALNKCVELILNFIKDAKSAKLFVFHSLKEESVKIIRERIKELRPDLESSIEVHFITPAVGAHIGPGVVGIGAFILN
jgi:DegV family protein with EDD domain